MPKKILILYTSVGLGHKSIAENIGAALGQEGVEVRLEDILKVQEGKLVNFGTGLHRLINTKFPFVWSWLYHISNTAWFSNATLPLRLWLAKRNAGPTRHIIKDFQPDAILTTQTTASAVIASLKKSGEYCGVFGIAFSDYHFHRFWVYPGADFYLANIQEQKEQMVALGISAEKIFVCGMTLKPKPAISPLEIKQELGIGSSEKVILVSSGSLGTGFNVATLGKIIQLPNIRTVVVCGKNSALQRTLAEKFQNTNAIVLGFAEMPRLYAIADIFITKPGGLSVAEALQWFLPMIIHYWLPGQEELNYRYLMARHLILPKTKRLLEDISQELVSHAFRHQLSENSDVSAIVSSGQQAVAAVEAFVFMERQKIAQF